MNKEIANGLFIGIILGIVVFFGGVASNFVWWALQQSPDLAVWIVGFIYTVVFLVASWWIIQIAIKNMRTR